MLPSDYLKQGYCKDVKAKDIDGKTVSECNAAAASWCLVGAYNAWVNTLPENSYSIGNTDIEFKFWRYLRDHARSLGYDRICQLSDTVGQDGAIEAALKVEKQLGVTN